ncbi:MAG: fumarylacetoacetate hydrolase family protein [Bdellovibrionales bacterium]|nr:fumarylacetoacetate hydrolase family protein [Bdellovibrionales bacterium]
MKLGTIKNSQSKDGSLVVISKDIQKAVLATDIATSLREAVENWDKVQEPLARRYQELNEGKCKDVFAVKDKEFLAALPRTWLFADGSSFIYHVKLVRKARKAPLPETLMTVPLMYQGECGQFLAPTENIPQVDFSHGTDFEGEVGVIVDEVPMGIDPESALKHIKLILLINDVSLRGLIPGELSQGFGFFQSKPASALSPFAVTPDELGSAWKQGRVHLPLTVNYNHQFFGCANAGEMHFHFGELISHAAKTRNLSAGTLIGSGTVSNEDHTKGSSCLAEKRMIEQIEKEKIETPFMKVGDSIEIYMKNENNENIFGTINQSVTKKN